MIRTPMIFSAALALAIPCAGQAAPPNGARGASPKMFLADAIQGDNAEVKLGQLAQSHASSPKVRDFGARLERDHARARGMKQVAARQAGVRVPTGIKPDAQAMYDKLDGLSGPAFDRVFVQYMLMDHRKDIAEYEEQAKAGNTATARLAKVTLPTLKQHLAIAQSLQ